MIANDASLTDNYTRTVVDGEVLPYLGTRMDVDTRIGMCLLSDDTRYNRDTHLMKYMSEAIVNHGMNDWIGKDDLTMRGGCRIIVEDSLDVGVEQMFDERQLSDQL